MKLLPLACLVATLLIPSTSRADCSDGEFVATFVVSNILGDGEPQLDRLLVEPVGGPPWNEGRVPTDASSWGSIEHGFR